MGGEEYKDLLSNTIRIIAQEETKKLMDSCGLGHKNEQRLDNIEEDIMNVKLDIKSGFKDLADSIKEQNEKKASKVWDIVQIVITVVLTAVVAFKA